MHLTNFRRTICMRKLIQVHKCLQDTAIKGRVIRSVNIFFFNGNREKITALFIQANELYCLHFISCRSCKKMQGTKFLIFFSLTWVAVFHFKRNLEEWCYVLKFSPTNGSLKNPKTKQGLSVQKKTNCRKAIQVATLHWRRKKAGKGFS